MNSPNLIDNSTQEYIFNKLKQCHSYRTNVYYYVFNISIFIFFCTIVSIVLYYCYNNKLTDHEKQQKMVRDQQYILSKIRFHQNEFNNKKQNELSYITDLPTNHRFE